MSDLSQTIIQIVAEQAMLEPADVTLTSTLADLDMDSLAMVEIIFAIEEKFGITIPFNANNPEDSDFDISSVSSIVSAVEGLIKDQA
ncbi:MAG: acyl carrier protein [Pseudomonadota bacterium]